MGHNWKWTVSFLWGSLPSSLQDTIRKWFWEFIFGFGGMMLYFLWITISTLPAQRPEIMVLVALGFFTVCLYLGHFIRTRYSLGRSSSQPITNVFYPKQSWIKGLLRRGEQRETVEQRRMRLLELRKGGVQLHNELIRQEQFNPMPPHRSWHSDFNDWHLRIISAARRLNPELGEMLSPIRNLPSWNRGNWVNADHQREQNMIWEICERVEKYLESTGATHAK